MKEAINDINSEEFQKARAEAKQALIKAGWTEEKVERWFRALEQSYLKQQHRKSGRNGHC